MGPGKSGVLVASYFSVWMDSRENPLGGKGKDGRRGRGIGKGVGKRIKDEKKEERNGRKQVCRKKQMQETVRGREYHLGS